MSSHQLRNAAWLAALAATVAVVIAVTGFIGSAHGHFPGADRWQDDSPHDRIAHDQGLNSCSICHLAHETSSGPVTPGTVSAPFRWAAPEAKDRSVPTLAAPVRRQRSRAPPCLASC